MRELGVSLLLKGLCREYKHDLAVESLSRGTNKQADRKTLHITATTLNIRSPVKGTIEMRSECAL